MAKKKSSLNIAKNKLKKLEEKAIQRERDNMEPHYKIARLESNFHKVARRHCIDKELTIQDYLTALVALDDAGKVDWSAFDKDDLFDKYALFEKKDK